MDCSPACLQMIAKHYGKNYRLEHLRGNCFRTREGVSLLGISEVADKTGFRTTGVKITFEQLCETPLPCIVHWKQRHFIVVYEVKRVKPLRDRVKIGESLSVREGCSPCETHLPSTKIDCRVTASPTFINLHQQCHQPK
jgi:ATP-binding cassette subfamily B protein